jgi:hypothetical protein
MGYSYEVLLLGYKDGELTELHRAEGCRSYGCMVPHPFFNYGTVELDNKSAYEYYYEFSADVITSKYREACPKDFDEQVIVDILKSDEPKSTKFSQIKAYVDDFSEEVDEYEFEELQTFCEKIKQGKLDGFTNMIIQCRSAE